jgi:hypothetical protein
MILFSIKKSVYKTIFFDTINNIIRLTILKICLINLLVLYFYIILKTFYY